MAGSTEYTVGFSGRRNFLPYYTSSPWGMNDEYFIFFSEPSDNGMPWLCRFYPAEGRMEKQLELSIWQEVPENIREEELLTSVLLPQSQTLLIPRANTLIRLDINSGETATVYTTGPEFRIGGPFGRSNDGKYVCGGLYPAELKAREVPSQTGVFVFDAGSDSIIFFTILKTFVNHFQFFPDSRRILFAHEGKTETVPDRLNVLDWHTGEYHNLYRQIHAPDGTLLEYVGHEKVAGNKVAAVRYPVSKIEFGLILFDPATGEAQLVDRDDYWHCAADAAGRRMVMDTLWWGNASRKTENHSDIILFEPETGRKEILKTVQTHPPKQIFHPHPQLNAAGNRLLFIGCAGPDHLESFITCMTIE